MLDLEPTDEQKAVTELCRDLALEVIFPVARQAEAEQAVPADVWKALLDTGLLVPVPEELGGDGVVDTQTQMVAIEGLAYGDAGITMAAAWHGAVCLALGQHGATTHAELLASLLSDPDLRVGLALYEGYGRSTAELETTIGITGDTVVVRGRKVGVPFANGAEAFLVAGRDPSTGALRLVTVPADSPGVASSPDPGGLALNAAGLGSVEFDTTVPAASLVGGSDAGPTAIARTLQRIRLIVAAASIGTAQRGVDYAAKYAVERIAFNQPIAGFQGVSFPLAESQMQLAAARLEIADLAHRIDTSDGTDLTDAVTAALSYAGESASQAGRQALQTLGGHGFITDHPVEIWYRSTAALSTLDFDPTASAFVAAL